MKLNPEDRNRIARSGFLDQRWYLNEYPDVSKVGMGALEHYLDFGIFEGRCTGPAFDSAFYVSQLDAPLPAGVPALLHYLKVGQASGLKPQPEPRTVPEWYLGAGDTSALADHPMRVVFLLAIDSGGTPQTNRDLMDALVRQGEAECLVLRCKGRLLTLTLYTDGVLLPLERLELGEALRPFPHCLEEYDVAVASWISKYRVRCLHIRHLAWQSLSVIPAAREAGARVIFSLHDYYPICPSVKLLDEQLRYCGGRCTASEGECSNELWPSEQIPPLKHASIQNWQQQFGRALASCDALITTTEEAKALLLSIYPVLSSVPFHVVPHERDFDELVDLAAMPETGKPLRILVPGFVAEAKGARWILQLARQVPKELAEWHVLGQIVHTGPLPAGITVHGNYSREGFAERVRAIKPHAGAILSVWPETWCHTLTELWSCGIPVIGCNMGAVQERILSSGGGWLVDVDRPESAVEILDTVRKPKEWQTKVSAVHRWQRLQHESGGCNKMARRYLEIYQQSI